MLCVLRDVTQFFVWLSMSCINKADVCELVGIFILNKLKNVFQGNTFGLHKDDGLAIGKDLSGLEIKKLEKHFVEAFEDCVTNITIQDKL